MKTESSVAKSSMAKSSVVTALVVALALLVAYGIWFLIVWLAVWSLSLAFEFDYTLKQIAGLALFTQLFYICFIKNFNIKG